MTHVRRLDHVGVTVADLDTVTQFFLRLGLEVQGRMFVEGEFLDTVIGIPNARTEIVMLQPPDGGASLELSSFVRPDHEPGSPAATGYGVQGRSGAPGRAGGGVRTGVPASRAASVAASGVRGAANSHAGPTAARTSVIRSAGQPGSTGT